MGELLEQLFGFVCGQETSHTFVLGGECLPLCQRCTGIYAGAAIAALLHLLLALPRSAAYFWLHGLCLAQMVPMGLYWIPQGPMLRVVSGLLFGFGLVAWSWLPSAARVRSERRGEATSPRPSRDRLYLAAFVLSLVAVPTVAALGGATTHVILSTLSGLGLLALAVLALRVAVRLASTLRGSVVA